MNRLEVAIAELARRLSGFGAPHIVIGGFANLQWGRPRLTENLDVTVQMDENGLPALLAALAPAFHPLVADAVAFARETAIVPMASADGVRVDLILARLPIEAEAIRRGIEVSVGGTAVRFATAEDLILHKVVSERPRDREDIEGIVRRQGSRLDTDYLRPRIAELALGLQRPSLVAEIEQPLHESS